MSLQFERGIRTAYLNVLYPNTPPFESVFSDRAIILRARDIPEQNKPNRAGPMPETRPNRIFHARARSIPRPSNQLAPETKPSRAAYSPRRDRAALDLGLF